ncbi:MAG TPA: isoprenylcysteine carboxylmethyltransferase family protein [Pirellulales bacterium]|jgi:protein-S-isoprenylcysteine O-methyltransferase Ste14|nr:isoprenylcysteine carboxylmethyltransferase family protein [Pirellulales bacterium]
MPAQAERFSPWTLVKFVLALPAFFALFLFLPGGTWAWPLGWLFILVFILATLAASITLWFVNPDIYVARSRFRKDTKRWDKILLPFILSAMFAIFPIAALDDARFHWSPLAPWVVGVGYFLFMVGYALMAWAQGLNRFFEPTVRLQTDRGQYVVDRGPYAVVRHPGYAAAVLFFAGIALALGSWWALIPAAIASALLILRTRWEDDTLQAELPGYQDYTRRVRYRLIPGVW